MSSLEPTEQTYESAKELLTKAFASPVTQRYDVIKRLSELKLTTSTDVYEFISEVCSIISTFKLLEIDVDTVLQFFIWNAMNDQFQSQLIQITNETKPDLEKIMTSIFSATERYMKTKEKASDKRSRNRLKEIISESNTFPKRLPDTTETNNLAVKINSRPFRPCCICTSNKESKVTHTLKDCPVYDTPSKKRQKLDSLKFCSKCSFMNHRNKDCRFKFSSPCRICKGQHLTYLCSSSTERLEPNEAVTSKLSAVYFNSTIQSDRVLLPTLSCPIALNGGEYFVRVLYDTGSQRNFVSKRIAEKHDLRVVQSGVQLVIQGFNSQKELATNIVSLPLRVNDSLFTIDAIVVPQIDANINTCNQAILFKKISRKRLCISR